MESCPWKGSSAKQHYGGKTLLTTPSVKPAKHQKRWLLTSYLDAQVPNSSEMHCTFQHTIRLASASNQGDFTITYRGSTSALSFYYAAGIFGKRRNARVFRSDRTSLSATLAACKTEAYLWGSRVPRQDRMIATTW